MRRRNTKPNKSKDPQKKKKQPVEEEEIHYDQLHGDPEEEKEKEITQGKFFACYLLTSLCPRFKGHTYIGFTVNPQRRIKQHNGEMRMGAFRTKRKRPWEMVVCIYGFPTNIAALQFEWAWQHPTESLAVRQVAATFKSLNGVGNKIKLAYAMLNLPSWQSLNMTINFFSTKYKKHTASCPTLPRHMKVQVCSMDELSDYSSDNLDMYENDWEIEDDHVVSRSDAEPQIPESNMFPDTSRNHCTLEASSPQRTNCLEDSNLENDWEIEDDHAVGGSDGEPQNPQSNMFSDTSRNHCTLVASSSLRTNYVEDSNPEQYLPSDDEEKDSNKTSGISSEVEGASSYSGSFNAAGSSKDRNVIKPTQFHLELDQPSRKFSATRIWSDEGKYSKKSSGISSEAEVIDLLTPSPCQKTKTGSNVIKSAQFHSELHQPSRINFSATRLSNDNEGKDSNESSGISSEDNEGKYSNNSNKSSGISSEDNEGKDSNKSSRISSEVEVIDLFTPSPCQTSNSGSRKRKRFSIWSREIIDLTD